MNFNLSRPIWITGAGGLIGHWLCKTAPEAHQIRRLARGDVDLTDLAGVEHLFCSEKPGAVLHCAAMSRSPECQSNPGVARKINVEATAHLAALAERIPFFLFSSDLVFDGRSGNYSEDALVNPLSFYAETKVAAEEIVLRNPLHTVIRTSLNSGPSLSGDRGFDEQIRLAWKSGETLSLFTDEFRCPIGAQVTATAVWELLRGGCKGIYHVAGSQRMSRFEIGRLLASRSSELNPKFIPASISDWKGAPRSPDTSLNCRKAQSRLAFQLPRWTDWLVSGMLLAYQEHSGP